MNTVVIRQLKPWISEIYLLLLIAFYWWSTGTLFNGIAIVLLAVVFAVIWFRNKTVGIIISTVFLLLNLYMVLALISELKEFPTWNGKAITMLMVGGTWLGLNIVMAIRMQIKWASPSKKLIARA